jgi:hypothetical protein
MPIVWEIKQTPGGKPYSRSVATGRITMEDVNKLKVESAPGGPIHGLSSVSINAPDMVIEPDARRAFSDMVNVSQSGHYALVVTSAPMRVMMTFILRLSGKATNTQLFADEASATAWVAEKLDQH